MSKKYEIIKAELQSLLQIHGILTPEIVLFAAKDKESKLHPFFQWDNEKAAHQWRLDQASMFLRTIKITVETAGGGKVKTRAFVCIKRTDHDDEDEETTRGEYHPIERVLADDQMTQCLLSTALSELRSFQRKYATLKQLSPVMDAIEELVSAHG